MRPSVVLGLLATLLPSVSAGGPMIQTWLITTNFTSPSVLDKTLDFSAPIIISWDLPTSRSAKEYSWRNMYLSFVYRYGDSSEATWPIATLDQRVHNEYTWEDPASFFLNKVPYALQDIYPTLEDVPGGERAYFLLQFKTANVSGEVGSSSSSAFAIEGVDGFEAYQRGNTSSTAVRPAVSVGALGVAALGMWLL